MAHSLWDDLGHDRLRDDQGDDAHDVAAGVDTRLRCRRQRYGRDGDSASTRRRKHWYLRPHSANLRPHSASEWSGTQGSLARQRDGHSLPTPSARHHCGRPGLAEGGGGAQHLSASRAASEQRHRTDGWMCSQRVDVLPAGDRGLATAASSSAVPPERPAAHWRLTVRPPATRQALGTGLARPCAGRPAFRRQSAERSFPTS